MVFPSQAPTSRHSTVTGGPRGDAHGYPYPDLRGVGDTSQDSRLAEFIRRQADAQQRKFMRLKQIAAEVIDRERRFVGCRVPDRR